MLITFLRNSTYLIRNPGLYDRYAASRRQYSLLIVVLFALFVSLLIK